MYRHKMSDETARQVLSKMEDKHVLEKSKIHCALEDVSAKYPLK